MRKLLNNPWFVAGMALAALILVARVVWSGGDAAGSGDAGSAVVAGTEAGAEPEGTARLSDAAILQALPIPRLVRDPFAVRARIVAVEHPAEPDRVDSVHLSAIWTQDGQTLVVINDRICQGGDEIGRLKIESATREGVWLTHWRGRDFLSLGGDFTLKTPVQQRLGALSPL